MPPFLASFAAKALAAVAAIALIFAAGFGTAWHIKNGDEAKAALAQVKATAAEIKRQTAVAMQSGEAAQYIASQASGDFARAEQQQSAATQTQIAAIAKLVPARAPTSVCTPAPVQPSMQETDNDPQTDTVVVYGVPWGLVRLADAAASGAADPSGLPIAAGEPDDAPSTVGLPEFATLLAANYGAARANAEQLAAMQQWAADVARWYADLRVKLQGPAK